MGPGTRSGSDWEAPRYLKQALALNGHVLDGSTEATLVSNGYSTCIEQLKPGDPRIVGTVTGCLKI
jgi:hypothetical protein